MARVNMTMGAKGGIGKTFVAATLAQYITENMGKPSINLDLDYKNISFGVFEKLNVQVIDLATDGVIDPMKFDVFVEKIFAAGESDHFVLDSGGNVYIDLNNYMLVNDVYNMLLEGGHELLLHIPITGGGDLEATLATLREVVRLVPPAAMIAVWLNPFHGLIERDGKSFEQSETFAECKDRIYSIVKIPNFASDMKRNVENLFKWAMTFEEGVASTSFDIMGKQRIKQARRKLFDEIAASRVCL